MLTKEEREILQAYSDMLRRAHAHELQELCPIGKVIEGMPELSPARPSGHVSAVHLAVKYITVVQIYLTAVKSVSGIV